jgi:hypothetical protein
MTADNFSTAAVWEPFYRALCGTQWEQDDVNDLMHNRNPDTLAAANALRHVWRHVSEHWQGKFEIEDGVLATLKAAQEHHGGTHLTPAQVKEMVEGFLVHYSDIAEPMNDYLEEEGGPVRWHWLTDHGKCEVEQIVCRDSEIWIDDADVSDAVWVFKKPGTT